ncbi:MAG TPA: hypothetical protein VHS78_18065 [Candidatus Elarobacter sp.]|nr:hypothetical protein [Candidatus Elarobacter sp.]
MAVFHVRTAERDVAQALGREFPSEELVVDLVHSSASWYDFVQKVVRGFDAYLE